MPNQYLPVLLIKFLGKHRMFSEQAVLTRRPSGKSCQIFVRWLQEALRVSDMGPARWSRSVMNHLVRILAGVRMIRRSVPKQGRGLAWRSRRSLRSRESLGSEISASAGSRSSTWNRSSISKREGKRDLEIALRISPAGSVIQLVWAVCGEGG